MVIICQQGFAQVDTIRYTDSLTHITYIFRDTISKVEINDNLLEAAKSGNVDNVIKYLKKGADVNTTDKDSVSALMFASQNGFLDVVKILVNNGAKVNARPVGGITALIAAARFDNYEVLDFLIHNGADMNAKDDDSTTALFYASVYGYFVSADMLLFYGADYNCKTIDSSNALIAASFYGHADVAELLINKGADVNAADHRGWTPLHCAVYGNHLDVVKLLVEKNAAINSINCDGYTPLSIASENGYAEIVELLLQHQADAGIQTNKKATPLILALYNFKFDVSKMIKKNNLYKEKRYFFNRLIISPVDIDLNNRDFMYGGYLGLQDIRTLISFKAGFNTRLWANRILLPISDNTFYQVWEKRWLMYYEEEKMFRLNSNSSFQKGIFISLKEISTYGKYRGMSKNPVDAFTFSPSLGFVIYNNWAGFRFAYEYLKFDENDVKVFAPHRLNLSMYFVIPLRKYNKSYKSFDWI